MSKKNLIHSLFVLLIVGAATAFTSCKSDEPESHAPVVALDSYDAMYTVKIGKTLTVTPVCQYSETAIYSWKMDGRIISTAPILTYKATELGDKYVSLSVVNSVGEAYVEMKISVVDLLLPSISMTVPEDGYTIIKDGDLILVPTVENNSDATYVWYVDGVQKASDKDFTFNSSATGNFTLKLVATNEDGSDEFSFPVKVCSADELPFNWFFEQTEYNLSQGRRIRLKIWDIENAFDAQYTWTVDGQEKQKGAATEYVFSETAIGKHTVVVTMKNCYGQLSKTLTVNVCEPEGTYKRTVSAASSPVWNKVYEFTAAPGQFVNESYYAYTATEAAAYAEGRLKSELYVSLGGFGGYIVVGFDHSIENDGSYNIQIKGNSFAGSSEPGIVWVMQDENGDGLPNDTWYELKGSEYGKTDEIRDYAVTYYKPKATGMSVQWTDNQGQSGVVDYLGSFHRQDYYYPNWITADSYTLRGTKLPSNTRETSPGYWYNGELEWGYVDNFSTIDRLTDDINYGSAANGNHFRISDAVTFDGKAANLEYIDFVKVVVGVNCKAGWLGEVSTEVFNFKDFNMLKNNR